MSYNTKSENNRICRGRLHPLSVNLGSKKNCVAIRRKFPTYSHSSKIFLISGFGMFPFKSSVLSVLGGGLARARDKNDYYVRKSHRAVPDGCANNEALLCLPRYYRKRYLITSGANLGTILIPRKIHLYFASSICVLAFRMPGIEKVLGL